MAQNPCISREEYLLDEARRELEASELADDNQLRNTIARLVGFVEELVGDEPSRPPEAEPGKIKLLVTVAGSEEIELTCSPA